MQLVLLNSLLMFDIVFMFFLFLVGVSCVAYYLPARPAGAPPSQHDAEEDLPLYRITATPVPKRYPRRLWPSCCSVKGRPQDV